MVDDINKGAPRVSPSKNSMAARAARAVQATSLAEKLAQYKMNGGGAFGCGEIGVAEILRQIHGVCEVVGDSFIEAARVFDADKTPEPYLRSPMAIARTFEALGTLAALGCVLTGEDE